MKTSIEFDLEPFPVPDFVSTKRNFTSGVVDSVSLSLKSLDKKTLEDLCAEFRAAVLKKATLTYDN